MKPILILLAAFSISCCSNAQPVKVHGHLKVVGTQLTDEHGNPVVLNGMSFGWSCFHPRFYTAGAVHALAKDWNCNVIRAALGVEPEKGYLQDSATSMKLITTVVDAAIKEGIYVIIDWHSHNIRSVSQPLLMCAGVKMHAVHQIAVTFDRIGGRQLYFLVPAWGSNEYDIVWIDCTNGTDKVDGISFYFRPAFFIGLIEQFVNNIGVAVVFSSHGFKKSPGFVEPDIVAMPVDDHINAFFDRCIYNSSN
jgi:hypothetical protein